MRAEQLGPYRLEQREGVFPLGTDTLCLAAFVQPKARERVWDLGCGSGALLLLMAAKGEALQLHGVELDSAGAELARANLERNGLAGTILSADLRKAALPAGQADLVVSNPPYYAPERGKTATGSRGTARSQGACTLDELCAAAARLLRNGGRFALCWPAEGLVDLLAALRKAGMEPKRLQLVQHRWEKAPCLVLAEGRRQGKPGLQVLPVRVLTHEYEFGGAPCPERST